MSANGSLQLRLCPAEEGARALSHRVEKMPATPARRGPGRRSNTELADLLRGDSLPIQTTQEFRALGGALACGKTGDGWQNGQEGRVWSRPSLPYLVMLKPPASMDDWEVALTRFTDRMTATHHLAVLWVAARLASTSNWKDARGYVDLGDVADAIYPDLRKQRTHTREAARRVVWEAIQFAAAASVRGERSSTIYRKAEPGKRKPVEVATRIDSPIWALGGRETPAQKSLFGEDTELPLRVEVMLTESWAKILIDPKLRQFVAMGELLGKIAPGKPSGALARSIGLSLFELWRRDFGRVPGGFTVARHELWDKYPPHDGNPDDYLDGHNNPRRALETWAGALDYLSSEKVRLIDKSVAREAAKEPSGRQGWGESWRREAVCIPPASAIRCRIWAEKEG